MAKTVVGTFNNFTEAMTTLTDFCTSGFPKNKSTL